MTEFRTMTLEGFTDLLASDAPAPGGGAVAALAAVHAVSLTRMVFALTSGKKYYEAMPAKIKASWDSVSQELAALADEFYGLMDVDAQAFLQVMDAFKLPKNTGEEKQARTEQIQAAYRKAAEVPLAVAKKAERLYPYLRLAAEYGNPNAISDAGVGVLQAAVAVEGAVLNVQINLTASKDKEWAAVTGAEAAELLYSSRRQQAAIMELVQTRLFAPAK